MMRLLRWCALLTALPLAPGAEPITAPHATYLGGGGSDHITACAPDSSGNMFVAGYTYSANLPVTPGAFQRTHGGVPGTVFSIFQPQPQTDAFVARFDRAGRLIYLTYIGGRGSEEVKAIALDAAGNVVLAGRTSSPDFPLTPGASDTHPPAGDTFRGFVAKLNTGGSGLVFSTLAGGAGGEISGVALDSRGDIYVAGQEASAGAFVAKLSGDGARRLYYRPLGGGPGDYAAGIAVDLAGNAYVTGATSSRDFPVTAGAFQQTLASAPSAFVVRLDPSGGSLVLSTLIGGSRPTQPLGRIAVDAMGRVSLTGMTEAPDFPVTPGAIQHALAGPRDAFVVKLSAAFSGLEFSTFLGGTGNEAGTGLAQDEAGNLWVTGVTESAGFPVASGGNAGAFSASPCLYRGASPFGQTPLVLPCSDAFLVRIDPEDSTLRYASTIGGSNQDYASDLALDASGSISIVGSTGSNDFPATVDALQPQRFRAACTVVNSPSSSDTQPCTDGFVARFLSSPPEPPTLRVLNRAGYQATQVAPGEIVTLIGDRIGPSAPAWLTIEPSGLVSTTLAGTRVLFDGIPGPLVYLDGNRIDVIVPGNVAGKVRVVIAIEREGDVIVSSETLAGDAAPGILAQGSGGTGQAAALNEDNSLNGPETPAAVGSVVSLYTLGVSRPIGLDGEVAASPAPLAVRPEVVVGNRVARVLYAGPSPGLVSAVTQINFEVPAVPPGDAPIYVLTAGYASRTGVVLAVR